MGKEIYLKFLSKNYYLLDVIQVFAGSISIFSGAIALYLFWNDSDKSIIYVLIGIATYVVMLTYLMIKFWDQAINRYNLYARTFHKLNHKLRDETYYLAMKSSKGKLSEELLAIRLEETGQFVVNLLSDFFTKITSNKISVHIKYFPIDVTNKNKNFFRTLCISHRSDNDRLKLHNHSISENSHMEWITNENHNHFASTNFKKTIQKFEKERLNPFKISVDRWKNWFNSIIIVPIRIKLKYKNSDVLTDEYEYLGFLVCDGKDKNAFRSSEMDAHVDIMLSFADELYHYIDIVSNYFKTLKKNNQNV